MKPQDKDRETFVRHTFDSFCKRVLKCAARDGHRALKRQAAREIPFSQLSSRELQSLAAADGYFRDAYAFDVLGASVNVADGDLAEALTALSADRREIVLMSYFFDMKDREIAERLNLVRRTVAYRRAGALKTLKSILESED
jgi:RNA polymerase sigma factor (sigma-70 family)